MLTELVTDALAQAVAARGGNLGGTIIQLPATNLMQRIYYRYLRMYGTQRATQYGYSLWEFSVSSRFTS